MLDNLTEGFAAIIKKIRGESRLTKENISETLAMLRTTLIDADVALPVVENFLAKIEEQALGHKVLTSLTPGQTLISLVQSELINMLGAEAVPLATPGNDPLVILFSGLQGAGKTTTAAKLAKLLKRQKKRVLVASTDVRRPAAIEQLSQLCTQAKVDFHEPTDEAQRKDPLVRANEAVTAARQSLHDYLLIDTAGRNVIDEVMMEEIKLVSQSTRPAETLLVVDATQGQEALKIAKHFDEVLSITGVCLTKLDGDARGGAAMSVQHTLGVPIKFIGVGEMLDDLQAFIPERMASRILGMGDIVSLVESATASMGKQRAAALEKKLRRKRSAGLQLSDMIEQMRQAERMGGVDKIADQLPSSFAGRIKNANIDERVFKRMEAIYLSMTKFERLNPRHIKGSHKQRIATGSGVEVQQVNQLLTQHAQANKFMKRVSKNPAMAMNMLRGLFG